jgi:hypothetical protein
MPTTEEKELKVADHIEQFIRLSDRGEERRRRFDRLGAQLMYSQHWDPSIIMPDTRSAGTFNMVQTLVRHKVAIMTKQRPIPVVVPRDVGDKESSRIMRMLLMDYFEDPEVDFQEKLRRAMILCHATRTSAIKAFWNPGLHGGAGNISLGVVPGWRLILDNRYSNVQDMDFIGDRAPMSRSQAMELYPKAAKKIRDASIASSDEEYAGGGGFSPVGDQYRDMGTAPSSTVVNGKPLITAFAGQAPTGSDTTDWVEVAEIYWKDRTREEQEVIVRDHLGQPKKQYLMDDDGMPVIEQGEDETIHTEFGPLSMPNFKFAQENVTEKRLVRVYPKYRRTTLLMPDKIVIDDRAWDGPNPYALFQAEISLDGSWVKGPALDLEDAQNMLNVAISIMNDNLRISSWQVFIASSAANIDRNSLVVEPGGIIRVSGDVNQIKPLPVPHMDSAYFQYIQMLVGLMEKIIGAEGIMTGSTQNAAPRADSSAAFDTLAEIGGSRIVECGQRMEQSIADLAKIVGWFAQKYYTEAHALAVEDIEGNQTWERAFGPLLAGTFSYKIQIGSAMAWSESAQEARVLNRMAVGLYDKVESAKRLGIENYKEIFARMVSEPPVLLGPGGGAPPRTRTTPQKAQGKGSNGKTSGAVPRA